MAVPIGYLTRIVALFWNSFLTACCPLLASRLQTVIEEGKGTLTRNAYLGSRATHVICRPDRAQRWLASGLSVVTPTWVLRSAQLGQPQPAINVSLDASKQLQAMASPGGDRAAETNSAGAGVTSASESGLQDCKV